MAWMRKRLRRPAVNPEATGAATSSTPDEGTRQTARVRGDSPIQRVEDDALGRSPLARSFAGQVLTLDVTEGVVVGVLGPWGSGKTSFVNLARSEFERAGVPILDFNPWMFSGAEQLVESFFVELSAQLKIRPDLAEVGKDLAEYGESFSGLAWLPLVGPWIERGRGAAKILNKILQRRKEGVGGRRVKLTKALANLSSPIVMVLDDIDRLSTAEIRHVFKLVRLTASFPNVIYIVAFDRRRVEDALAEQGIPGRDYLEKILQVAIDLPAVPDQVIRQQILSAVNAAVEGVEKQGPFDEQVWPDLFAEVIRPLIRSMRDVRRYAVAVGGTVRALDGQLALADVLALEAVRMFLPDVFARIHSAVDGLTTTSDASYGLRNDPAHLKTEIEGLQAAAGDRAGVVRSMITRLFPAAQRHLPGGSHYGADWQARWLRERRVAQVDLLRLYLERVAGDRLLAFVDAEHAWMRLADRTSLDSYLRSVDPKRLEDVIAALETYEDEFRPEHVVPGTIVLLNLLPDIPDRPRGMFDFGAGMVVGRVTLRLLRSLKEPDAIEAAVRAALPEVTSLSSKFDLITTVGHREHAGHRLVSTDAAAELERAWRAEVRAASSDALVKEWDLLRILLITKTESDPSEGTLHVENSPRTTLAILRAALGDARSQAVGSRAVRRSPRLRWKVLTDIYGDEATLRARIEGLKAASCEGSDDLLALADKYLDGWQPGDFSDE